MVAISCPRTRTSCKPTIVQPTSYRARDLNSSVHSDLDPLDIPSIASIGVARCQFGSDRVTNQVSLLCTAAKEGCVSICVGLAFLSVIARVVKSPPIRCGLATVSIFVADFHHSAAIALSGVD